MATELGIGPLSSTTRSFAEYAEQTFAENPEDSRIRATFKAELITAANGIYAIAMLVEKASNFIINGVTVIVNSQVFHNILEKVIVEYLFQCTTPAPWSCNKKI